MSQPIVVIPLSEIITGMRTTTLLALFRSHCRCISHFKKVVQLKGFKTRKEAVDYALCEAERRARLDELMSKPFYVAEGPVVDPAYDHDHQTVGIRAFNDHIRQDHRVEQVILPLRDGLTIIHKK